LLLAAKYLAIRYFHAPADTPTFRR